MLINVTAESCHLACMLQRVPGWKQIICFVYILSFSSIILVMLTVCYLKSLLAFGKHYEKILAGGKSTLDLAIYLCLYVCIYFILTLFISKMKEGLCNLSGTITESGIGQNSTFLWFIALLIPRAPHVLSGFIQKPPTSRSPRLRAWVLPIPSPY